MSWLQPEPMEPIPEEREGEDWPSCTSPLTESGRRTTRKKEVFTSEQVDTLISTVPKNTVPQQWCIENEVVDPQMATSYLTESLAGPASARGSTYSYTYESHYDNPPDEDEMRLVDDGSLKQTHKVTRVTKVTTTRSVRQIPVDAPYGDMYFDAAGLPTPSPVVELEAPLDVLGIRLSEEREAAGRGGGEGRHAPPPAPPMLARHMHREDSGIPPSPGAPEVVSAGMGEVTLRWEAPPQIDGPVVGYQIEMRDYPDGEWERAHDQLLRDTTCTITHLDTSVSARLQFRVSAAGRSGFGAPSLPSTPMQLLVAADMSAAMPNGDMNGHAVVPLPPSKPEVVSTDGHRAIIQWQSPVADPTAAPIGGYQIEYRVYGSVDWMVANDVLCTDTRYQVDNLRPNGVYEFRVRGRSADGLGQPSRSSGPCHVKPAAPARSARSVSSGLAPPGQPQVVESDLDWVKLDWSASSDAHGYVVEFREVGDPLWHPANQLPINTNCIHVEGLRPGSTYEFRVLSVTQGVYSEPSEVSDVVPLRPLWKSATNQRTVPARPCAPEYVDVEGDRVSICWLPAQSTLPVLGYDVEFRDFQQDAGWYKVNDAPIVVCKMTVGDLIVGHEYQFRVLAHNGAGPSQPGEASAPLTITEAADAVDNAPVKYVEAERFGTIRLLQDEMVRESPPLPDRDDSPPPIRHRQNQNDANLQWRDPNLKEVIDYLSSTDREKQLNASGYLQHLTYSDNLIKEETRELGGIGKLIGLLRSDHPKIQRNACACIKNLCFGKENDRNKMAVLDADGVRMLSALLHTTPDAGVKEEATAALWNLSSADPIKPAALESAADPLVQQVIIPGSGFHASPSGGITMEGRGGHDPARHYNSTLFKNATGVLRNISAANQAARKKLRESPQLIESLVHFLTVAIQRGQCDTPAVENAVCLLRNLSYRIQEVADPNYDPSTAHSVRAGSKSAPSSPKAKKKEKKNKKADEKNVPKGAALLWQPNLVKLYLKLLQEASNLDTLEASAGAIQNLAACSFPPSAEVRATVRVEKGLPVLVELIRLKEDHVVCAVATALRNLSLDQRNRELIGKYALRDLVDKLPAPGARKGPVSDQTIGAVLGILFEVVRSSAPFTKDVHEAKGTDKLRALARSYPTYSHRVCKYASQVLYMMWQHKELHDGFKRSGLKECDFYSGSARRGDSATLARPISSQGREKPYQARTELDDTMSSGYGATERTERTDRGAPRDTQRSARPESVYGNGHHQYNHYNDGYGSVAGGGGEYGGYTDDYGSVYGGRASTLPMQPMQQRNSQYQRRVEPVYASVRKGTTGPVDDSWV